jgi:hypothetical protein
MVKHILNLMFNIHDIVMKALSNELSAFMMWILDIMNMHVRQPSG